MHVNCVVFMFGIDGSNAENSGKNTTREIMDMPVVHAFAVHVHVLKSLAILTCI